jgi:hypothetical protein
VGLPTEAVTDEPATAIQQLALVGAASLGVFSLALGALTVYLIIRNNGYFYRAKVRQTHRGENED